MRIKKELADLNKRSGHVGSSRNFISKFWDLANLSYHVAFDKSLDTRDKSKYFSLRCFEFVYLMCREVFCPELSCVK